MPLTIHQDAIGNKYIGYAGDVTNIASVTEINNDIVSLLTSFPGVTALITSNTNGGLGWRTDGTSVSGINRGTIGNADYLFNLNTWDSGVYLSALNSRDAGSNDTTVFSDSTSNFNGSQFIGYQKGLATFDGVSLGIFGWILDANNDVTKSWFVWTGKVTGNSNIAIPQTRASICLVPGILIDSYGVKQGDSTTKRIHLDTEAGANHLIDCGTDTGRLYLIEDDGTGGDGGAVGYCENLYLSKKAGLTIGGFVTIDGITDGGSEQGIVVGQWGDNAHLIMRVYDGVS